MVPALGMVKQEDAELERTPGLCRRLTGNKLEGTKKKIEDSGLGSEVRCMFSGLHGNIELII